MPLATGGTPRIELEAWVDTSNFTQRVADMNKRLDALSSEYKKQGTTISEAAKKSQMSWTDFRSMYSTMLDVVRVGQQVWAETAGEVFKYDEQIRKLAEVSGTGAEESSRLIQVMDDFKLSADDVFMATKALTKEGLSPTIDTLAQLSDQYNKLNPGQERAEFLMTNFGKSGLKFAEAMSKGGDALKQMGTEVEKSLIRTDAQVAKTRLAEMQFDKVTDKIQAYKVEVGTSLIGMLDGSTVAIQRNAMALFEQEHGYKINVQHLQHYTQAEQDAWEEASRLATEQYLVANGMDVSSEATDGMTESLEDQAAALKEVSDLNNELLDLVGTMQSSEESFNQKIKDNMDERFELEKEKRDLLSQGYTEESEEIQAINDKLQENTDAAIANADEHELQNRRIILGLLERQLTQDGILDDKELTWLLEKGVAWGIYSDTVISEAKAAMAEADNLAGAINAIPNNKTITITMEMPSNLDPTASAAPVGTHRRSNASGLDTMIPMSFGNEGFNAGGLGTISGGERVTITPRGQTNQQQGMSIDYSKLARSIVSAEQQAANQ